MLIEIFLLLILPCIYIYYWLNIQNNYWKNTTIPYLKTSKIFGSIQQVVLFQKSAPDQFRAIYNHPLAANEPVIGIHMFYKPALLIRDPELIKNILIKDFHKFPNRYSKAQDPLANFNLFFLRNPGWKQMRNKLTPVFTSGKIKQMFYLIEKVGDELDIHLNQLFEKSNTNSITKELKEMCALYTTDVIASVAFGLQANCLTNPNSDFRTKGRAFFKTTLWRAFEFNTVFYLPVLVSLFRCKMFSDDATKFLRESINYAMDEREKSNTVRHDLIDILLTLRKESKENQHNNNSSNDLKFEGDVLVAQAAVFFAAGFETTSASISFALFEMCKNQMIQKRLRDEIQQTLIKYNNKLTYESISEMVYLNMIVSETLRMYPPLAYLDRVCLLNQNDSNYSLEPFNKFQIPNGMPVFIPAFAIHRDPKYFPNPDVFDPERFSPQNKSKINPYTYMPFGLGPHNCIGERLGLLQTKIGLIKVLRNHKINTCDQTLKVMKLEPKAFLTQAAGGIYCNIVKDPLIVH